MCDFEKELIDEYNNWKKYIGELKNNQIFIKEEYDYAKKTFNELIEILQVLKIKIENNYFFHDR